MRKLVLSLSALLSVAVVAAMFVLLRSAPREIDAQPMRAPESVAALRGESPRDAETDASAVEDASGRVAVLSQPKQISAGEDAAWLDSLIAGEVVDESGRGLAGATVEAAPIWDESQLSRVHSGSVDVRVMQPRHASTDSAGHFEIQLNSAARVRLAAQAEGFRDFDDPDEGDGRTAGSTNIRIVLQALGRDRFSVVDARTQQPIEHFGLRLYSSSGVNESFVQGPPTTAIAVANHPGGVCELFERPDTRRYQIEAPGYAPQTGPITAGAHSETTQTIRLERAGSIHGHVLLDGKPAPYFTARLQRAQVREPVAKESDESDALISAHYDVDEFIGRARSSDRVLSSELKLGDLATGTYELEIRVRDRAKLVLEHISVVSGAETALGDLQLDSNPLVRVVVLLPDGRIPALYKIAAKCGSQSSSARVDSTGAFEISDLPAGHWSFSAPREPNFVCAGPPLEFDVAPREKREITIDLRDRAGGWLVVNARIDGQSAAGVKLATRIGTALIADGHRTDARGRASLWVSSASAVEVFANSSKGLPLGRSRSAILVPTGGEVEVALDLEAGTLVLELASLTSIDGEVLATLSLETPSDIPAGEKLTLRHGRRRVADSEAESRRFELGWVGSGTYRARVQVTRSDALDQTATLVEYARDIVIRTGEAHEMRFTEADRVK